jgi:hypothetical protein
MSKWYVKVRVGKLLLDKFSFQNYREQGKALLPLLLNLGLEYAIGPIEL